FVLKSAYSTAPYQMYSISLHDALPIYVERRLTCPDAHARLALAARLAVLAPEIAVECHGQDARRRGLADAARASEQVGVRRAPSRDRRLQRLGDVLLHGHLAEPPGPVETGQCFPAHCTLLRFPERWATLEGGGGPRPTPSTRAAPPGAGCRTQDAPGEP